MKIVDKIQRMLMYYCSNRIHALIFPCVIVKFKEQWHSFDSVTDGSLDVDALVGQIMDCNSHQ